MCLFLKKHEQKGKLNEYPIGLIFVFVFGVLSFVVVVVVFWIKVRHFPELKGHLWISSLDSFL